MIFNIGFSQVRISKYKNEIINEFGTNWEKYCENGICRLSLYGEPIRFFNGTGYEKINTRITSKLTRIDKEDYQYTVRGLYNAYFKQNSNGNDKSIRITYNNYSIVIIPKSLKFIGQSKEHIKLSYSIINENSITYRNQFGNGIDLRYTYYPSYLKEEIVINSLKDIINNIKSNPKDDDVLQVKFIVKAYNINSNESMNIKVGKNRINLKKELSEVKVSNEIVEFLDKNNKTIFYFKLPIAYDSKRDIINLNYSYSINKHGNLVIKIFVPYSWLKNARYPVVIDPTISLDWTKILDDNWVTQKYPDNNQGYTTMMIGGVGGKWEMGYWKWNISQIPPGSVILDANWSLYCDSGGSTVTIQVMYLPNDSWDEDTITWNNRPTNFNDTPCLVRTEYWQISQWYTLSIKDCVQNAVDDYDGVMSLVMNGTYEWNHMGWRQSEFGGGGWGSLVIEYTITPNIENYGTYPEPVEIGENVTIWAKTSTEADIVNVTIQQLDGTNITLDMIYNGTAYVVNYTTLFGYNGTYNYTIHTFKSGFTDSETGNFTTKDTTPPTITNIILSPPIVNAGSYVNISWNQDDNWNISLSYINITAPNGDVTKLGIYNGTGYRSIIYNAYKGIGKYDITIYVEDLANINNTNSSTFYAEIILNATENVGRSDEEYIFHSEINQTTHQILSNVTNITLNIDTILDNISEIINILQCNVSNKICDMLNSLNENVISIQNNITLIKNNITLIKEEVDDIINYFGCSKSNEVCDRLKDIRSDIEDIYSALGTSYFLSEGETVFHAVTVMNQTVADIIAFQINQSLGFFQEPVATLNTFLEEFFGKSGMTFLIAVGIFAVIIIFIIISIYMILFQREQIIAMFYGLKNMINKKENEPIFR